ncbi:MAG: DUF1552 domain-containing protein [Proteobacteria bacterium]|nr:DUF1552 domain-containing protein [Pseudomonadota bacterium]
MRRPTTLLSRRDLMRSFGLSALLIHPVLRSMAYAAETPFKSAPRYVLFFKGGSFYPSRTAPASLSNLAGTPIAPLQPHARDLLLFRGMNIHGGSPKSDGYKEEHAAGVYGCVTGNTYKYFKNDSYFAYTDHESIDVHLANQYRGRAELKDLPLASLHIGGGAHSDADNVGVGSRYISFRDRRAGDTRYGNAIEPMQDSGAVYDLLMRSAAARCTAHSSQPASDTAKVEQALAGRRSVVDFIVADIKDAKRRFGMDTEHAQKLDGLLESWSQSERAVRVAKAKPASAAACPTLTRPNGNGANKQSLDVLSPVHDQMIDMIRLAFEMDLTRVVAFTLSGGASGQTWPSRGIHQAHHTLEHSGNVDALVKIDTYYAEKFARLLTTLKGIDDGGGKSALYNSSVFLGMECWSNSSSGHYLTNVPFILAGQGGGYFETGRIIDAKGRNNNDIHVAVLNAAGIKTNTFGLASLCQGPIV